MNKSINKYIALLIFTVQIPTLMLAMCREFNFAIDNSENAHWEYEMLRDDENNKKYKADCEETFSMYKKAQKYYIENISPLVADIIKIHKESDEPTKFKYTPAMKTMCMKNILFSNFFYDKRSPDNYQNLFAEFRKEANIRKSWDYVLKKFNSLKNKLKDFIRQINDYKIEIVKLNNQIRGSAIIEIPQENETIRPQTPETTREMAVNALLYAKNSVASGASKIKSWVYSRMYGQTE